MAPLDVIVIIVAGLAAGTINTVVGSGTLITFPTLLFLGYPPVAANISNSLGLSFSGLTATQGARAEMDAVGPVVRLMLPAQLLGSALGAGLLLVLPPEAFTAIVPVLIVLAALLVVLGRRINGWLGLHRADAPLSGGRRVGLLVGALFTGAYGGYFGAAQGVLLIGLLSALTGLSLLRINVVKNILAPAANFLAALVFVVVAWHQVRWAVAGLLAIGALGGGWLGARIGRRLPPAVLRAFIVLVSVVAVVKLVWFG
ncbi:sulfite exporter TauE/SafE family protein [Raineyella sp. LH-20]|uniref:sulfite exporter TauE/SafE family protein n=1 Tax=Raineyella sp. LH-20 TaxID=3081204 RepID=UPI0029548449|nr:sulfite exporter TauE/SafE family protein [Raineyella sp. LH-20]WOP19962.1 sulfite exporter TauE/SafE family protein [Raineyella sp. LH-20]